MGQLRVAKNVSAAQSPGSAGVSRKRGTPRPMDVASTFNVLILYEFLWMLRMVQEGPSMLARYTRCSEEEASRFGD